jgi:hypothetical protein
LDARVKTLLPKKIIVVKSKEVKTGWSIDKSDRIFYRRLWLEKGCFANDDDNIKLGAAMSEMKKSQNCGDEGLRNLLFISIALCTHIFLF